jgi:Hint domain-containing protein/putative VirB-like lipoprotein
MKRILVFLAAALVLAGCAGRGAGSPTPSGSGALSTTQLRLRVLHALPGPIDYCDPDVYPVARGTQLENARSHEAAMRRDPATYDAIRSSLGIQPNGRLSDDDLVRIYQLWKQLNALRLTRDAAVYRFDVLTVGSAPGFDRRIVGTIDETGHVRSVISRAPRPNCPICLARGVRIATPTGPVSVERIRVGMSVWSVDRVGRRIRATVVRTRHLAADGELLRIALADGRSVVVSPGHPTPNGRLVGQLMAGDQLDGVRIISISTVPYRGRTYDLLPSGPTGDYFADAVLLGSTIRSSERPEPIS